MPRRRTPLTITLRTISRAFADLERHLAELAQRATATVRQAARKSTRPRKRKGRKLHITRKRRAQLKLQGVYMTYMRQLRPRQKARVRAAKEKRGFEAAIRLARRVAPASSR